ncbi:hypothetical protein Q9966_012053 [Columba livia]|nr:hypothetical protein Q9966_012053 [Columba livia]
MSRSAGGTMSLLQSSRVDLAFKEAVDLQFQSEEKQNLAWPLKSSFNLGSAPDRTEEQVDGKLLHHTQITFIALALRDPEIQTVRMVP